MNRTAYIYTYTFTHRKTYDLISLLKLNPEVKIVLLMLEPHYQKKFSPMYNHRPASYHQTSNLEMVERGIVDGHILKKPEDIYLHVTKGEKILVAGAGIIPPQLVQDYDFINSHPGWLPNVRGLDSLKWAINDGNIIGVTTHIMGEEADSGFLIDRKEVHIADNDTFHSIAFKQYELEVSMLEKSLYKDTPKTTILEPVGKVTKRMPSRIEKELLAKVNSLTRKNQLSGDY